MTEHTRYCLTQDDDGHWYVIPEDKWEEFSDIINEEVWPLPD